MLTPEQIEFFKENGYLLVKGLLSRDEAAMYRQETHDLATRVYAAGQFDATWGSAGAVSTKKTALQHCHDVQFHSAAFARLIVDERLTDAASAVMGTPNVQLHHTKMFIKPSEKGSPFPMHQDAPFFPHQQHSMIAAIIHFDDAPLEKGPVRVVPGSHKLGMLPHLSEGRSPSRSGGLPGRRGVAASCRGGRRSVFLLSHHSWFGPQCVGRSAHHAFDSNARSRRLVQR